MFQDPIDQPWRKGKRAWSNCIQLLMEKGFYKQHQRKDWQWKTMWELRHLILWLEVNQDRKELKNKMKVWRWLKIETINLETIR